MYTDADGRTYVYVYRNRWDPEKKQSRIEKRCHVGRLDPQTGQVHLGRKFLTNNPEYAGKFWLYDNNQLIEQEPFEQPDTDNEPQPSWRGEDVELGLTWAAWQFAVDHGLLEDLQETFGEDTGTVEEVYEPFLIMEGFIKRTPRGRMATHLAYEHLGRDLYKGNLMEPGLFT